MATHFLRQRAAAADLGLQLVKDILSRTTFSTNFSPRAFTTAQLYRLAVKEPVPQDFAPYPVEPPHVPKVKGPQPPKSAAPVSAYPPHPEHPIRSVKFLKTRILPRLQDSRFIRLVRTPRAAAEEDSKSKVKKSKFDFLWSITGQPPANPPRVKEPKVPFGRPVGVGLDISHLNKRRQRARVVKLRRDVQVMKSLAPPRKTGDALPTKLTVS